ncbi:MAG: hemerythrin domain-containing protein [Chloroflexi bacterium]|nr:hemerythrin domain-containing protein [Chloroflexota bacterium]
MQLAAQAVSSAEPRVAAAAIDAARTYLDEVLLPALNAEEFTLFIAVNSVFSHPEGCEVMSVQHRRIRAMVSDLGKVADAARKADDLKAYERYLQPLLYGLYALIRTHLESEDEAYLPLLDEQLSESQVQVIVTNIGRVSASSMPGAEPGKAAH